MTALDNRPNPTKTNERPADSGKRASSAKRRAGSAKRPKGSAKPRTSSGRQLGRHLLVDFFGVEPAALKDRALLMGRLQDALEKQKFSVIRSSTSHKFRTGGQGVTGFFMLAQSHAAFHSYPEYGYLALDIYSCGTHDPRPIARALKKVLKPKRVSALFCERGGPVA